MADKLALVTGASSGIGYWLAKDLATRGYDLVVCSAGERLDGAAEEFKETGVTVTAVSSDLATRDGIDHLWKSVMDLGRPLDVACINAGISFAHSLRYELRDTGVSVTTLQPGPTDTDFFHRAGMDNTKTGSEGKHESEPEDVARQGLDALFDGKDHVYSASFKTKMEGMLANVVPGSVKGAMHEKMAKPFDEK